MNDEKRLCCYECEEAYEARIAYLEAQLAIEKDLHAGFASECTTLQTQTYKQGRRIVELEAEIAVLKSRCEMVDADMEDDNAPMWSASIKLPPSTALATAREAGAREFAEWWDTEYPAGVLTGDSLSVDLARFLASTGTGIAEGEEGEEG